MNIHIGLFVLLTFTVAKGLAKDYCNVTFHKLFISQSQFVECAVRYSVPATTCINCNDKHTDMIVQYKGLVENCSEKYISQNRLDMVYNMELYLDAIWNKGFCYDCFDDSNNISNETHEFNQKKTVFDDCLNKFPHEECPNCMKHYIELNDFFKEMEKLKKGKVCFDLQDAMNSTRLKWSKELKCCHRDFNLTLFLVGSGIFCAVPLIFYLGMYGYTKRLERNHELIDSTYGTSRQQDSPSTSAAAMSTREAPPDADEFDEPILKNIGSTGDTDAQPSTSGQSNPTLIEF